jgi:hypothetical protein
MMDPIRRRFRDKIEGRAESRPGRSAPPETSAAAIPDEAALRILKIATGPFPAAAALDPAFPPGGPAIRLTLELGMGFLARMARPDGTARDRMLALCPGLLDLPCGDLAALAGWLLEGGVDDGLGPAHLIGHATLDLAAAVAGPASRACAVCAWCEPDGRFDLYLDGVETALGRSLLLLAAAAVRDLALAADRTPEHILAREALARVVTRGRTVVAPEDLVPDPAPDRGEATRTLDALARFGYLEPLPAAFTFSSPSGILYRVGAASAASGETPSPSSGPRTFSIRSR